MNIETRTENRITIIRIQESRIDATKAPDLKSHLSALIEEGKTLIGIDMSQVNFIDSSGLGALVSGMKKIGRNGSMALWGLNRQVKSVFELTQLYKVFEIFENENDTVETLSRYVAS